MTLLLGVGLRSTISSLRARYNCRRFIGWTQIVLKLGRRYLTHVQNSALEGEVSEADLTTLENEIEDLLKAGKSTIIYDQSFDTLLNRAGYREDPTEDWRFL